MFVLLTFALLMVGDHQSVKRRLGIWFRPDLWALVSFFHFMDSSKPLAFSLLGQEIETIDVLSLKELHVKQTYNLKKQLQGK